MSQSYNQVIERNRLLSIALYKIKGFGNGLFSDIIRHDQIAAFKYPLMYMEDIPVPMPPGVETFGFRVHFMSKVARNKQKDFNILSENANEIKSDMRQACKDFLAFWVQDHDLDTFSIEKATTPTFFQDETADRLAGCYIDITFKQPFSYNVCAIPADDVPPPPSTTCDPATYKNSDDSFIQSIDSGASFTAPDVIITINTVPQAPIPANKNASFTVSGSPVETTMNTDPLTDTPAGQTKDFTIVDQDDNPVVVTEITDTANIFKGQITIPIPITTALLTTGQENVELTGDDGDRFLNGDYASKNAADISNFYTLVNDNEFGHKKRFTGDTGGFMDEATGNFFDVNGVATTKALAFPNDIMRDYAWRRRWYFNRSGARSWANCVTLTLTESRGGEVGWFCPNRSEYESLSSSNANAPTYIDNRLFNWSTNNMWCSTTSILDSTRAQRLSPTADTWSGNQPKTQSNANAYVKMF